MKLALLAVSVFLAAVPSGSESDKLEQLMRDIEKQVRLPDAAKRLDAYARYYAGSGDAEVTAIYMVPGLDELPPGEGCEELVLEDTSSDPLRISSAPCSFDWPKSKAVGAGNRVWLPEHSSLPMPMQDAGDCGVVSVVYRTTERRFLEVACFGESVHH